MIFFNKKFFLVVFEWLCEFFVEKNLYGRVGGVCDFVRSKKNFVEFFTLKIPVSELGG